MRTDAYDYATATGRNAGFVTAAEQDALRRGRVFVCGVGGMGGAAVEALVRAGVGHIAVADVDRFEISNLNRQVFATLDTVGQSKADATRDGVRGINPECEVEVHGSDWVDRLDEILPRYRVVINGMDDLAAGIQLYRRSRVHHATVLDAYTSPLPSVTVVRPTDPRPEERLRWPTIGTDWRQLTAAQREACKEAEALYVVVNSSSARQIDLEIAAEMFAGRRPRPSFAPMVILTGNLLAFEAVKLLVGRPSGVDHRGVFFDPWSFAVERARPAPIAWILTRFARRVLRRLAGG